MSNQVKPKKPSLLQVVRSVLSAAIGIRSNKSHDEDFEGGDLKVYIAVGLVFIAIFIATVFTVVSSVLPE